MSGAGLHFEKKIVVLEKEILTPEEQGTSGGETSQLRDSLGARRPLCVWHPRGALVPQHRGTSVTLLKYRENYRTVDFQYLPGLI